MVTPTEPKLGQSGQKDGEKKRVRKVSSRKKRVEVIKEFRDNKMNYIMHARKKRKYESMGGN